MRLLMKNKSFALAHAWVCAQDAYFNYLICGILTIFLTSTVRAEDPKTKQTISGIAYGAGAYLSALQAKKSWAKCGTTDYWACVEASAQTTLAGTSLYRSNDSFDNADQMDNRAHVGRPTDFTLTPDPTKTLDPTGTPNLVIPPPTKITSPDLHIFKCPTHDSECMSSLDTLRTTLSTSDRLSFILPSENSVNIEELRQTVKDEMKFAQSSMDSIQAKGISLDDIKAHPEKYLTQEQVAELKSNPEKYGLDSGNSSDESSEEKTDAADASQSVDSKNTFEIRTIAGSNADFAMPNFSMFGEFSGMFDFTVQEGLKNSAPGYYGNVSLQVLDPKSKMSLFERVSTKIRKVM